jgi:hypothetical protein
LDLWSVDKKAGTETVTIVGGKAHLDLPDATDSLLLVTYQYFLGSGDFDIRISINDYTPDSSSDGFFAALRVGDNGSWNDWSRVRIKKQSVGPYQHYARNYINGVAQTASDVDKASVATGFRITRVGTVITLYHEYLGSWVQAVSDDFGERASNISTVHMYAYDDSNRGGSIEFDNLIFVEGCPSGYPKAWTTTSSTTTTTTTTTV